MLLFYFVHQNLTKYISDAYDFKGTQKTNLAHTQKLVSCITKTFKIVGGNCIKHGESAFYFFILFYGACPVDAKHLYGVYTYICQFFY
jgi:hypothetical protein